MASRMSFDKLSSFNVEQPSNYSVSKYVSSKTGLQLIHIKSDISVKFEGYFAFETGALNFCVPYSLGKLINSGSEKYPYPCLLEEAGKICMCHANHWCSNNETVYSWDSVTWNGAKKLIPAYLDHLFSPLLTNEAYTTEIVHIDPESFEEEGNAIFEMKREKTRLLLRPDWGFDHSIFTRNVKQLKQVFEIASLEEIKEFHNEKYTADNLLCIINGDIEEDDLLEFMEEMDEKIDIQYKKSTHTERTNVILTLPQRDDQIIEQTELFPESDLSLGEVHFYWNGPTLAETTLDIALKCIFDYLFEVDTDTYQRKFNGIEASLNDYCSFSFEYFSKTLMSLDVYSVPKESLPRVKESVLSALSSHKIDMERLREKVALQKSEFYSDFENFRLYDLSIHCIKHYLCSKDEKDSVSLEESIPRFEDFNAVEAYTKDQWQKIFDKWICKNKPTIIIGEPSAELQLQADKTRGKVIAKRIEEYGPEGSTELKDTWRRAIALKEKSIPNAVLSEFLLGNPSSGIKFLKTTTISSVEKYSDEKSKLAHEVLGSKPADLPMFIHISDFPSEFTEINLLLSMSEIKDVKLLPYYHVFNKMFSMPMRKSGGSLSPHDDTESSIAEETEFAVITRGFGTARPDCVNIVIIAIANNYEKSVEWIKRVLYDTVFDAERVTEVLKEYIEDTQCNYCPDYFLKSLKSKKFLEGSCLDSCLDDEKTTINVLEQAVRDIENGEFEQKVLPKLKSFRSVLIEHLKDSQVIILGDVQKIGASDIYEPWVKQFGTNHITGPPKLPSDYIVLSELGKCKGQKKAFIYEKKSVILTDMILAVSLDITYDHADYPAIIMAIEILRNQSARFLKPLQQDDNFGLFAGIQSDIEKKELSFEFYRSADAIICYEEAKNFVLDYATRKTEISTLFLNEILCSKIEFVIESNETYNATATTQFENMYGKNVEPAFEEKLLVKMGQVNQDTLVDVMNRYFVPLFDASTASLFVGCNPSKTSALTSYVESIGYNVSVHSVCDEEEGTHRGCCD